MLNKEFAVKLVSGWIYCIGRNQSVASIDPLRVHIYVYVYIIYVYIKSCARLRRDRGHVRGHSKGSVTRPQTEHQVEQSMSANECTRSVGIYQPLLV